MNVAGKTVFITGSTDGVGRYVAQQLAAQGANLLIHGRNTTRGKEVADQINRGGKGKATFYQADLSSLAEVRKLADRVGAENRKLDIFISNAGIGSRNPPERAVSADGHELRFAVNYLPGFVLAYRLLPIIKAAAPARIVNVSSLGQAPLDFDNVMLTKDYQGVRAYSQSKLAQIMFTIDLAEELRGGSGVTVNALHPATYMNTTMVRAGGNAPISTVEEGGAAILHLATGDDMEGRSGLFFNGLNESRANAQAYDATARKKLRELSMKLTAPFMK